MNEVNEVSVIINGVRYDAIEENDVNRNRNCAFWSKKYHCVDCIIGMNTCERLIGNKRIFKKSNKNFEK